MESLIGYGSDDDYEEVSQPKKQSSSQADANYEEVQMDLSEESNDSTKLETRRHSSDHYHSKNKDTHSERECGEKDKYKRSSEDKYKSEHGRYSPKYQESRKEDKYRDRNRNDEERSKDRDDKNKDYKKDRGRDDKNKSRDDRSRDSRRSREDQEKYNRDGQEKYNRDGQEKYNRDGQEKYNRDGRSYDSHNNKEERRSRRSSSRERHRSRSPRRSDYRSKRSSSRDRTRTGYSKRYDRTSSKMDRLEKLGIELNTSNPGYGGPSSQAYCSDKDQEKDRFFMPGITGRFTEQIQRRKLLWQKKDNKAETSVAEATSTTPTTTVQSGGKVWQNTTFAQDTDGKVANKFKRLMGIRGNEAEGAKPPNDNLKKQEEMFTSMEAQYEVARTATHTMRGVGLGFGSFQR